MQKKKLRIVFACSGHPPFDTRVFHRELKSLKKKYKDLHIVAPYSEPSAIVEGINIHGFQHYRSRFNRWSTLRKLYREIVFLSPDIIHCHEPDSLLVAHLVRMKMRNIRIIYDCHEFYPQRFPTTVPGPFQSIVGTAVKCFEDFLASRTDAIATVHPLLIERFSRLCSTTVFIPNYPPLDAFTPQKKSNVLTSKKIRLIYAGGLTKDRGLFLMLDSLKELRKKADVTLTLVGWFDSATIKDAFFRKVRGYGLFDVVDYKGILSYRETVQQMMDSDIGLFLMPEKTTYVWALPIKYFEYAAAGIPVVMMALADISELINRTRNGIAVPLDAPQKATEALEYLIKNPETAREMAKRGRRAFEDLFNWSIIEPTLFRIYDQLLSR